MGADYVYVDETDPSVTKAGTWSPDGNPASHNSGILYSNEPGAYVEFTFTGTEITYVGQKVFNRGKADIYIDGEKAGTSDAYDAGILYQKDLFTVTGLPRGEHTIKVCYTGTKNDAASGDYIDLDAFVYRDGKDDASLAPFEALTMNFDGGAFDDENWTLNAHPGNPPLLAGDRFEKTISDYAEGFLAKPILAKEPRFPLTLRLPRQARPTTCASMSACGGGRQALLEATTPAFGLALARRTLWLP